MRERIRTEHLLLDADTRMIGVIVVCVYGKWSGDGNTVHSVLHSWKLHHIQMGLLRQEMEEKLDLEEMDSNIPLSLVSSQETTCLM